MFSTSGHWRFTLCCTCAVRTAKKFHVSGYRREAGDVRCLRCLIRTSTTRTWTSPTGSWENELRCYHACPTRTTRCPHLVQDAICRHLPSCREREYVLIAFLFLPTHHRDFLNLKGRLVNKNRAESNLIIPWWKKNSISFELQVEVVQLYSLNWRKQWQMTYVVW